MKPRLFIGSSVEGLLVAEAAQANLYRYVETTIWHQGIFELSKSSLDSLQNALDGFDFALFVFTPDDVLKIRGEEHRVARDNVIFELGLFVGRLNKEHCFLLLPENQHDLHLPTDLLGVNPAKYENGRRDGNLQAATSPACAEIREAISKIGVLSPEQTLPAPQPTLQSGNNDAASQSSKIEAEVEKGVESPGTETFIEWAWFDAYRKKDYPLSFKLLHEQQDAGTLSDGLDFRFWDCFLRINVDFSTGVDYTKEQIAQDSSSASLFAVLARSYFDKSLFSEAFATIDQGLAATVANERQFLVVSKANFLNEIGKTEEATAFLEAAILTEPNNPDYYVGYAEILMKAKELTKAKVVLERGLRSAPNSEELLSEYADLTLTLKDFNLSLLSYNRLITRHPTNPDYFARLGNVYLQLDLNGLAAESYDKANELAKEGQGWIWGNLGNLYKNRGFYPQAIKFLKKALELEPDSEYAHNRLATAIKSDEEERKREEELIKSAYVSLFESQKLSEISSIDKETPSKD